MKYEGSIWRPPSEARSLILQASIGCSKSISCTFCISYREKVFRVKSFHEFRQHVKNALEMGYKNTRRIFLADGNALGIKTEILVEICHLLYNSFPLLERIGVYGSVTDILRKSPDELLRLKDAGLGIIYTGLESGDNFTLKKIKKGVSRTQNITACHKVSDVKIPLSVMIILGLGGKKRSHEHAKKTASMLSEIDPDYLAALTLMLPEGTEIYEDMNKGLFQPLSSFEILRELLTILENTTNQTNTVFRTNHASNYLPLRGILMQDQDKLVNIISQALEQPSNFLRSEMLRGL
ncbi:MAG: radical SAM protein [Candidatus Heimdallarchaeota archaeon]|nr:radical SAM protein [Candidatus Heimdallarchaeota archaeon]